MQLLGLEEVERILVSKLVLRILSPNGCATVTQENQRRRVYSSMEDSESLLDGRIPLTG